MKLTKTGLALGCCAAASALGIAFLSACSNMNKKDEVNPHALLGQAFNEVTVFGNTRNMALMGVRLMGLNSRTCSAVLSAHHDYNLALQRISDQVTALDKRGRLQPGGLEEVQTYIEQMRNLPPNDVRGRIIDACINRYTA